MEDIRNQPTFTLEEATLIAWEHFGIRVVASSLPGERDQNFKLACDSECDLLAAEDYVLKIANPDTNLKILELENSAIQIAGSIDASANSSSVIGSFDVPKLIRSSTGSSIVELHDSNDRMCFARCISFLPGQPLATFRPHTPSLLQEVGRYLGRLDDALSCLNQNVAARRDFKWKLENAATIVQSVVSMVNDPLKKNLLQHFMTDYGRVAARIEAMQKSVIHNDANDYNMIVNMQDRGRGARVGLIDFGDIVYSTTVNELAICGAYVMLDKQDPIAAAVALVSGYHDAHPLDEDEMSAVFPLMCMRLCQSVCIAAEQQRLKPGNKYLGITEKPAWETLERLARTDAAKVHSQFSRACSMANAKRPAGVPFRGAKIESLRTQHIGPSLSLSYDKPLHIIRGAGQYLYDASDITYLDCVNNVCHVGHCRPEVVGAASAQMSVLNTNTRYLHENIVRYAQRLTATLPAGLEVCFFVNSGSEANDLALRLARAYTHQNDAVVIDHAYHGHVSSLIDLSPYKFDHAGGSGRPEHVHVLPVPDRFRGPFGYADENCGQRYADLAIEVIDEAVANGRTVAAFFAESLLGCGGQIVLPDGYLLKVYARIRAIGGLCIADEVQVGFGRVGTHFWGFEKQNVVPDIVTMGKPIGNGHPLAAVVTTHEIAEAFNNGMEYFNTFGGNPVSCAVGMAVLDVIEKEGLQQHALEVGNWLLENLESLKSEFSTIGDVRGSGLFLGVELVSDRETLAPAAELAHAIVERMKSRRILLSTDGPFENVIKFKPPMVFSRGDAERLVMTLRETLKELSVCTS